MSYIPGPLIGATITITKDGQTIATLTTDAKGEATTTLNTGSYNILVHAENFEDLTFSTVIPKDNYLTHFAFKWVPKHAVNVLASESFGYGGTPTETAEFMIATPLVLGVSMNAPIAAVHPADATLELTQDSDASILTSTWEIVMIIQWEDPSFESNLGWMFLYNGDDFPYTTDDMQGRTTTCHGYMGIVAASALGSIPQNLRIDGVLVASGANQIIKSSAENYPVGCLVYSIQPPNGTVHLATVAMKKAYEIAADSSVNADEQGTWEILHDTQKTFHANIGSAPVCYYSGDPPTTPHYAHRQWTLDGSDVPGATGSSYTPPAQTPGTSHTVGVYWSCEGV
jgi:hypothetical protein